MKKRAALALKELDEMKMHLLLFNGAVIAVFIILGFIFGFDWRDYTALAAGNLLAAANFITIGITAEEIVRARNFKRGQFLGNLSYGLRYIGIFTVLALLLTFELINPLPAVIPLFYTKIYYTFFYMRLHREDD